MPVDKVNVRASYGLLTTYIAVSWLIMASVLVVPWRLVFFVLTAALPLLALAGPLVNVALQSSFNAGPYLLELL